MLTIALSKGRIFEETLPLLAAAGIVPAEDPNASRKLILDTNKPDVRIVLVRATDVPTYVQYGGADLGIAGKDVLLEHGGAGLYQPLDLGIARCRMMVAVPAGFDYDAAIRRGARIKVATKYVETARRHFAEKGMHVDLIKLYGSMELAPLVGLAEAIVDLVSTGSTLAANNLVAVEEIMPISARLVVNQAALKLKRQQLQPLLDAFEAASAGGRSEGDGSARAGGGKSARVRVTGVRSRVSKNARVRASKNTRVRASKNTRVRARQDTRVRARQDTRVRVGSTSA